MTLLRQKAPATGPVQGRVECKAADGIPVQAVHACAVHAEHPLDLVVHPLPEPDFHGQRPGSGFHLCRGEGGAIRQRHALGKAPAHLLGQRCVNDHRVGLGDMALRGKDLVGEAAVIRQQNKAGAGLVQPAGREQLPPGVASPIRSTTVVSRLSVEALTTPQAC